VLSNRIYVLSKLGCYDEADGLLKEFRMLPATLPEAPSPDLEVKVFATSASLELAMLARSGDFTKAVDRSESIAGRLQQFDGQLGALRKAGLLFHWPMSTSVPATWTRRCATATASSAKGPWTRARRCTASGGC